MRSPATSCKPPFGLILCNRYVRYSDCPAFDAAFKEAHWSSQADGAHGQQLQIVWQQQALLELRAAIAGGCMRFVTSEQVLGLFDFLSRRGSALPVT